MHPYRRKIDWYLLGSAVVLSCWSVFHLYTLSTDGSYYYFYRQLIWVGSGLFFLSLFYLLPTTTWSRLTYLAYLFITIFLIGVLIKGEGVYGARRWLEIGWIGFQPSEFAKIVLIGSLAKIMAGHKDVGWKVIFLSFLLTLFFSLLIAAQPDLGTALILIFLWLIILFISGVSLRKFLIILGVIFAALPFSYFFLLRPYQKLRILTFLDPQKDPLGAGWSSLQSKIALGSGGILGKGIGGAAHTQLKYLPQPFTDFIFSSIGEQWGFIGAVLIISVYFIIIMRGIDLALRKGRSFAGLFSGGFTALIALQAFVNMGMASGIIPVTGVPLPFLSYGGSSTLLFLSGIGILLAFNRET